MSQLYRVSGVLDLEALKNKKIVFVGLGSLGSLTLANLCYPFAEVVLIDPDKLEDKNVERHLLGPGDIGKTKVMGCRNWLLSRGAYPRKISVYNGMVQDVLDLCIDADLVIMSVDNRGAKLFVNEFCKKNKIPLIAGGVYPLGDGGEIITITNFDHSCLRCVEHQFGRDAFQGKYVDYGLGTETLKSAEGELKAVPALRGPVSEIAAVISEIALDIVQGKRIINHIYLRSRSWTPVIYMTDRSLLKILAEYINIQGKIGLQPNCRLTRNGMTFQLEMSDCSLRLEPIKWDQCPEHQKTVSLDEI